MTHYEPKKALLGMTVIIVGLLFFAIVIMFSNSATSCAPIASAQNVPVLLPADNNTAKQEPSYQTPPKLTFLSGIASMLFPPETDSNGNQPIDAFSAVATPKKPITKTTQLQLEKPTAAEQPQTNPEIVKKPVNQPVPKATDIKNKIMSKKTINALQPHMYKVNTKGQLVCKSNNDKPEKSSIRKRVHMDMECCLDPDEIPNPHCHYPPAKYGYLLKKF